MCVGLYLCNLGNLLREPVATFRAAFLGPMVNKDNTKPGPQLGSRYYWNEVLLTSRQATPWPSAPSWRPAPRLPRRTPQARCRPPPASVLYSQHSQLHSSQGTPQHAPRVRIIQHSGKLPRWNDRGSWSRCPEARRRPAKRSNGARLPGPTSLQAAVRSDVFPVVCCGPEKRLFKEILEI